MAAFLILLVSGRLEIDLESIGVKLEVEVGDEVLKVHQYDSDIFTEGEVINIDIDKNKVIIIGEKDE